MLQNSHPDGKKMRWDWDKVTLQKEQLKTMESHAHHCYSGIDNGMKVCHFLNSVRVTELEAALNVAIS